MSCERYLIHCVIGGGLTILGEFVVLIAQGRGGGLIVCSLWVNYRVLAPLLFSFTGSFLAK